MKKSVCKKCRREGIKLFLKGERCLSPKCAFTRRSYAPGSAGTSRSQKPSDYCLQLREKQKAKAIYNLRERQFSNYYKKAAKPKQSSGERLMQLLETRLDNAVYKSGYTPSIISARQLIRHKKILINGKNVNIPSYQLKIGEKISPAKKEAIKLVKSDIPLWIKFNKNDLSAEIIKIPSLKEINSEINEDIIVKYYSR